MAALATPILQFPERRESLFEITDHLEALFNSVAMVDPSDDETIQQIENEIELYLELEVRKVDSIAGYISRCQVEQNAAADEIKLLQARKKAWEAKQTRVEATVTRVMLQIGQPKLEGRKSALTLKKCPPSVEILDQTQVPQEYIRVKVEESVDKTIAARALKTGICIPGLQLVTDKTTVVRS